MFSITDQNNVNKNTNFRLNSLIINDSLTVNGVNITSPGPVGPTGPQGYSIGSMFYLNNGSTGSLTNYNEMSTTAVLGTQTTMTCSGTGVPVAKNVNISGFITPLNVPNVNQINSGSFIFYNYIQISSNGGSPSYFANIYKVAANNSLSIIINDSLTPLAITTGTINTLYTHTIPIPQTTLNTSDRLAVKFFCKNLGAKTATFYFNDNTLGIIQTNLSSFSTITPYVIKTIPPLHYGFQSFPTAALTNLTAYACYLGYYTGTGNIANYIKYGTWTAASNPQGEIGLFTGPNGPNESGITLTGTTAITSTITSLATAPPCVIKNTSDFNYPLITNTHYYAVIRPAGAGTVWTPLGCTAYGGQNKQGWLVLSAGASSLTTYSGGGSLVFTIPNTNTHYPTGILYYT